MPLEALPDSCPPAAGWQQRPVLSLSADRGLRVPVGLRGHRAGGAQRSGRVDVPADDGRPERLRRDAGPGRRMVQVRSRRRGRAGRPALPAGDHGAGDQLGLRQGWIVVRECLVMGPWQHDHPDGSTHIRPPTDYDAEHMLLRTVRCVDGQAQLTLDCVPAFDYGRQHARWLHTDRGYTQAVIEPEGLDLNLTLTSDIRLGLEGAGARAPDAAEGGRHPLLRAVLGQPRTGELQGRLQAAGVDRAPLAALAGPRPLPRPPLAQPPGAQRPDPQGPDVRADRRHRRRRDHLAARDAGRRAELGLPLHLDA